MSQIREVVPVGFKKHKECQDENLMPKLEENSPICKEHFDNARKSLGTLGGGNHFIEIQKGDDGYIWVMIHSGSRNLGKQVCDYYSKIAKELNEKYHNYTRDLGFLPLDSDEGKSYLREMKFALEFAKANRDLMVERIKESFKITLTSITFGELINIHHNYASMENHFGKNVMIHRKGATRAYDGELGIIPGSQGTSSYIVKGKGNTSSFKSCSHGAGRKMSRSKARRELDLDTEKSLLDEKGIIHSIRTSNDLDEASSAYKDIDVVMEEQKDLVDIVVKLEPLGVIKG
jgi:tRNA-splicing ligase RtcB